MIHVLYPQVSLFKADVCTLSVEVLSGKGMESVPLHMNLYVNAHCFNVSMHISHFHFKIAIVNPVA